MNSISAESAIKSAGLGKTHVVAAERQFRLLARNDFGDPISATMAAVDGSLFVRTGKVAWCLK